MTSGVANGVPAESDWLCEGCGYVLSGLPPNGNCPECGQPMRESALELRHLPLWEQPQGGGPLRRFFLTTAEVIFRPTHFYRTLATRTGRDQSVQFARIHWAIAGALLGAAAWLHADWFLDLGISLKIGSYVHWYAALPLAFMVFLFLAYTTRLAARLTTFEATLRRIRLPVNVVRRGLDYHAAHNLPVALLAFVTVLGYRIALGYSAALTKWGTTYLYTLCVEVVLGAAYLFKTYWIGMRNMMYASS
jgi:predicted nucleic acid-binding Zn ribbon protein